MRSEKGFFPGCDGEYRDFKLRVAVEVLVYRRFFVRSESGFLGEDHNRNSVFVERSLRSDDEIARRIGHSELMQCLHGYRNDT